MRAEAEAPALEGYALTKNLRTASGGLSLWRSPDIVAGAGQCVAVLGDEASDIELLFGVLCGLTEPTGGVVRIQGERVTDLHRPQRARLRARKMGFLFQQPKLLPELDVLGNVILPLRYADTPRSQAEQRARAVLGRLGIDHLRSKKAADLTPMEAQSVALARALLNHPAVVLAHEPTTGLSPEEAERFLRLLQQLCREEHIAVLVGTSDPRVASYAEHMIRFPRAAPGAMPMLLEGLSPNELLSDLYETEVSPLLRPVAPFVNWVVKPLLYTSAVVLVVVFLTFFGLAMARAGQAGQNADVGQTFSESWADSMGYLSRLLHGDLGTYQQSGSYYYWDEQREKPIAVAVARTLNKSLVLLLLSILLGGLVGVPLGLAAALGRHRKLSLVFLLAAIVGVSTPSFFLALLLQIAEIMFYRRTGIALVPVGGFGWDNHIVLPALVLAARPIAQVARVSFVALAEVLDADYIRTAQAKGLTARAVLSRHALRNAAVPILTALSTSLRFSLSSLPIVEAIFHWPGIGDLLLNAIREQDARLAATLTLILGVFFVLTHVVLDYFYRWIDPRLREEKTGLSVKRSWVDMLSSGWTGLREVPDRLGSLLPRSRHSEGERLLPLPAASNVGQAPPVEERRREAKIRQERRRAWVQSTAGSLPFVLGTIILVVLLGAVIFGQHVAPRSPYSPAATLHEGSELKFAPFAPSAMFLLGTDPQGRDIWSLLLYGARRTLSLAFFAVLARILLGGVLGAVSGWFPDSLLDRAVMGLTQVVAAFPSLLLAMVLIYAFGIRQGLWVFTLALCLVGWGEAAQFVRGQVMRIREQDYIEGALATGLGDAQLLARHVLPNLVPSLVVLACLEMGGVLMILGELGFVGVFIGGGWTTRGTLDSLVTYFDVPEWGVMLSNTWRSFRSYPWMTFYPALAFTIAIVGFNLFGEGLRRLTERLTLSMHRIINRYTVGAALGLGALLLMTAEGTRSWPQFASSAGRFSSERATADVRYLASPSMAGRGMDTPELDAAADYIAGQFASLGLQPAAAEPDGTLTYFATSPLDHRRLLGVPLLELRDSSGQLLRPLIHRQDYVEIPNLVDKTDHLKGEVVWLGINPDAVSWPQYMDAAPADMADKILLVTTVGLPPAVGSLAFRAVLVVAPAEEFLTHRELVFTSSPLRFWSVTSTPLPHMFVSPEVADVIVRQGGYSLREVRERQNGLGESEGFLLRTGVDATLAVDLSKIKRDTVRYVQAIVPGSDDILDNEVVLLLAHYDGQGPDVDGTLYPGANKNASGVAVMLEVARLLKEADYQPRRTLMFVAWAGAELHAPADFTDMLEARPGFVESYRIAAAIELTGVGAGTNDTLLLDRGTSGRLTEVLQQAARRCNVKSSTLGTSIDSVYSSLYPAPESKIPYISVTWDGSYATAHTQHDTIDNIQPGKLRDAGRVTALAVMYLGHEREY